MQFLKLFRFVTTSIALILIWNNIVIAKLYNRHPFYYRYYGKDEKLIDRLDERLRKKLENIESCLNYNLESSVHIYLTMTLEDFQQMTRGRIPKWAGGVAFPRRHTVVLKMPFFFGQGVPLEVLAAHELTHIVIHGIVGDNYLPRWLEEGLCQVISGESRTGSLARLGRAAFSDRLMGLPRVDDVLSFSEPRANLAYAESRSAAAKLIDQYGWISITRLLTEVGKGREFETIFLEVFEVEYEYWQVEWIEYARKKYSYAVLLDVNNLIWILILMLGMAAMMTAFIRRRYQFRKLSEEEGDQDDNNEPNIPF
ncbi:hypothetical protein HQ587_04520 [bacterium]|nr:hypothetical protein [bacterium]